MLKIKRKFCCRWTSIDKGHWYTKLLTALQLLNDVTSGATVGRWGEREKPFPLEP